MTRDEYLDMLCEPAIRIHMGLCPPDTDMANWLLMRHYMPKIWVKIRLLHSAGVCDERILIVFPVEHWRGDPPAEMAMFGVEVVFADITEPVVGLKVTR